MINSQVKLLVWKVERSLKEITDELLALEREREGFLNKVLA